MRRHKQTVHGNDVFKCPQPGCQVSSARKVNLMHLVEGFHGTAGSFSCDHPGCTFGTTWRESFAKHKKHVHSDEKPFVCDHTGCSFRTKAYCDLMSHKNAVHLNIRDKQCHVCEKRFHTNTNLRSHMATHEGDGHEMAKCEDCSVSLKHKSVGKTKPAGEKFIHCDHPGGTFQSNIANHKRQVHSNERPFDCDHSECHTKTMGNLSRHKNTVLLNAHLKVRAKRSPVCDNQFFLNPSLMLTC